jgi:hypothetical protein
MVSDGTGRERKDEISKIRHTPGISYRAATDISFPSLGSDARIHAVFARALGDCFGFITVDCCKLDVMVTWVVRAPYWYQLRRLARVGGRNIYERREGEGE